MAKVYPVSLAGESFSNRDGSSRQAEIARCRVGERVTLSREPDNPHDSNATLCLSARGVGIGMVSRDMAEWVADCIDREKPVEAIIAGIQKPERSKNHGVVLSVSLDGTDPASLLRDPSFRSGQSPQRASPKPANSGGFVAGRLRRLFR